MDDHLAAHNVTIYRANREAWLESMVELFRPFFARIGYPLPNIVRVSVGHPSSKKRRAIGQCHATKASADASSQIFVHPRLEDPIIVGSTLVHELCHAALDCEGGHGQQFKKVATQLGLVGKMTATEAGPFLLDTLGAMVDRLGPFPHVSLNIPEKPTAKRDRNRYLKVICDACHYTLRATRMWLDVAVPHCPNPACLGGEMTVEPLNAAPDDVDDDPAP